MKIVGNSLLILFEFIVLVVIIFAFAMRTSTFQTFLAQKGAVYLSEYLDTDVSIGKVDIAFFDRIYLDNVHVKDQENDTLATIDELLVNYDLLSLELPNFQLDKVKIDGANFHLKRKKGEEHLNLQFIIDAFSNDEPKDAVDFSLAIDQVILKNGRFSFHDDNKEIEPFGIDYQHLDLKEINLNANNILITPTAYSADLKQLAFKERSGFELEQFKSKATFSNQGVFLKNTEIISPHSTILLKQFELSTNDLDDYQEFVDNVDIISELKTSEISLKDVSYFAPQLEGMEDVLTVSVNTSAPVNHLTFSDLDIQYGNGTQIKGDFYLPDFRRLSKENIQQEIHYLAINTEDLQRFKLPKNSSVSSIEWPESLHQIQQVNVSEIVLNGSLSNLMVSIDEINSNVGNIKFSDDFIMKMDTAFTRIELTPNRNENLLQVHNLELNKIVSNSNFGKVNGVLGFKSALFDKSAVKINHISGHFKNTEIYDYKYDYIELVNLNYSTKEELQHTSSFIDGNFYVRDENLDLSFEGMASFGQNLSIDAGISLECANLNSLHPSLENRGELIASLVVDARGKNFDDFKGKLSLDSISYEEGDNLFETKNFNGFIHHKKNEIDSITIASSIVDAEINGVINYEKFLDKIVGQLYKVFPIYEVSLGEEDVVDEISDVDYNIILKDVNPLLKIFYPSLNIASNSHIEGNYVGKRDELTLQITADYFKYDSIRFENVYTTEEVYGDELIALLDISEIVFNDSLSFHQLHFTSLATKGYLDSQLLFKNRKYNQSNIQWFTHLMENSEFDVKILPSFLTIDDYQWNIEEGGMISYRDSVFQVDSFKMENELQRIAADGKFSESMNDRLYLDILNFDLSKLGGFLGNKHSFSGDLNVSGFITTPFNNLQFFGESILKDLYVNNTEVGDVNFGAGYRSKNDYINMYGDIYYHNQHTFHFDGKYRIKNRDEEEDLLDFNLDFNATDIAVVNEFLDPDVIKDLKGKLSGELRLRGSLEEPELKGKLDFQDGMVNLAILGSDIYFDGEVESEKDVIFINKMPIKDVEGNTGFVTGSLFHTNFDDFLFEIIANMEEDPIKRAPNDPSKPLKLDRFKVMHTKYDVDQPYYGDAYITGIATISGSMDNLAITVNAKTQRGTEFVLPLYGPTTIEEEGFITFKKEVSDTLESEEGNLDLTGIDLNLNFEVTDDALVKLVFDEKIGDEISAKGSGNISLSVDKSGELLMDGVYTVADGSYNFVMGPYKQKFNINPGGTVQWAGDPFDAILDISAYYKTSANLAVVMPDALESQSSMNEEVKSLLNITGEMSNPQITFDLEAPKASESAKDIIARIKSDPDELNKQFFSILVTKSFMPLSGQQGGGTGGESALLDFASSQINSLLNQMAEGYQMNVNLDNDEHSGEFSGEFGISKSFLDGRLYVSGSVGIGTTKDNSGEGEGVPNQNRFIGDVMIEYLLNQKGTFRLNVFNESNNYSSVQTEGRGQFTQGIGISYKEDFHTVDDFKVFQSIANVFRKKKNRRDMIDKTDNKTPIPEEYLKGEGVKTEEE